MVVDTRNGTFKDILLIAEKKQITALTPSSLSTFAETLHSHKDYDCLFLVLENIEHIYQYLEDMDLDPDWSSARKLLLSTRDTTSAFVTNRDLYSINLPHLDLDQKSRSKDKRKQALDRIFAKAPFWACLGYQPIQKEALKPYRILLAHFLLCRIMLMGTRAEQLIQTTLLSALKVSQQLTREKKSSEILKLPTDSLSPIEYLNQLKGFLEDSPVHDISYFFDDAVDLYNSAPKDPDDDLSPEDSDALEHVGVTSDALSSIQEDPGNSAIVTITAKRGTRSLLKSFPKIQIRRWIAQKNQLFPFSGRVLSDHELKLLLKFLREPDPVEEIEEVEARAMLSVLFWGPMNLDRLSQLEVTEDSATQDFDVDSYNQDTGELILVSPWPDIRYHPEERAACQLHPRQKWLSLPLPMEVKSSLNLYLEKMGRCSGRIFPYNTDKIRAIVSSLVSDIYQGSHFRVTSNRIYSAFLFRLSRSPFSDPSTTVLTTGDLLRNAETKIHYASFSGDKLRTTYLNCRFHLLDQFEIPVDRQALFVERPLEYLGTPKRPKLESVKSAFAELAGQIQNGLPEGEQKKTQMELFINKHNAYVAFVALLLEYSLGFRSVSHPYVESQRYDPVTGFSSILDKDIDNGNHSRPVWMPEVCRAQLTCYRKYLDRIISIKDNRQTAHEAIEKSGKASLFFLKQSGTGLSTEPVKPETIEAVLKLANYHIPLNSQRHFFKSTLQESGCPVDAIELYLGHWDHGEEGYSVSSALDPHTYRAIIEKHLTDTLKSLEIVAVNGPRRPGGHFHISLEMLPPNTSAQHRKKRLQKKQTELLKQLKQELHDRLPEAFLNKLKVSHLGIFKKIQMQLPDLFDEDRRGQLDMETIDRFYYEIDKKNRKRRVVYTEQLFFLRLLRMLRQDISVDQVPPAPLMIKPEPSLVRSNMGDHLYLYRQLVKVLIGKIENLGDVQNGLHEETWSEQRAWLGLIYTCAIVFGGVLSEKWAESLPAGLSENSYVFADLMWVDLWSGGDPPADPRKRFLEQRNPERYRRWVPDPITQALIIRWRTWTRGHHVQLEVLPLEVTLSEYLSPFDGLKNTRESYVQYLIKLGMAAALIHLPPFMVAYATNKLTSANLPDERWFRVVSGKSYVVPESPNDRKIIYSQKKFLLSDQKKMRLELCRVICPSSLKDRGTVVDAKKRIEIFLNDQKGLCPIMQLLAQWAIFLLSHRDGLDSPHKRTDNLALSTTRKYVTNVGSILVEAFRWKNPILLDEEDLSTIYENLKGTLEKKSRMQGCSWPDSYNDRQYRKFIYTFNLFHWYLEQVFEVSYVPAAPLIRPIKHKKRGAPQVSAQLILPEEYRQLLEYYNFGKSKRSRLDSVACCILILAYRMGLRRTEILGLRIKDALLLPLEIRVAKHKGRTTKSKWATRRLPGYLPMPQDEKDFLIQWISNRYKEPKVRHTSYLLTEHEFTNDMLDDHQLVPEILDRLKEITQDPGSVLHHCRHSFYSNLVVQSAMSDKIPLAFSPAFVSQGCKPGHEYWDAVMGNTATGRTKLHAIVALSGHGSIDVGMNTYMNLSDWLLGYLLRHPDNAPFLTGKSVAKLFNLSDSRGHEILREEGYPFVKRMQKACEDSRGYFEIKKMAVESSSGSKHGSQRNRRVHVLDNYEIAYERAIKKPAAKRILAGNPRGDEVRTLYEGILATVHGSTAKKMVKLAGELANKKLKINVLDCESYKCARNLLWLLDKASIGMDHISATFHLPPQRSDPTGERGLHLLDQWRKRVPAVRIGLANTRSKYKAGIVRLQVDDIVVALVSLLAQE